MLFLRRELIPRRPDLTALRTALQQAIQLEHATIPVYLYALYSLDPTRNGEIAAVMRDIAEEEMLHMLLACNLLNALGGAPVLDRPDFVPVYPGPLPGTVAQGLIVRLAPFSRDLVRDVFLPIEEPDRPLPIPPPDPAEQTEDTITVGEFYGAIKRQLLEAGDAIFCGDPHRQIRLGIEDLVAVVDAQTAVEAIDLIVEQGEGMPRSPTGPGGEIAHYYRFSEIFHGRRLIPNPDARDDSPEERFRYGGPPVNFDPAGVRPLPTNPKLADHVPGSHAHRACSIFNYTYTALLRALHLTVNGQPDHFTAARGLMHSLKQQALEMTSGYRTGGQPIGPSFEYQPAPPA